MILTDIQTYLVQQGKVSLAELAIKFKLDANALRPMLKRLIRKGRIRQMECKKCSGCHSCAPEAIEFYEWVDSH